MVAAQKMGEV